MRHHARDGEAHARPAAGRVVAAAPLGILHDGLPPDLVERDGLRVLPRRRRQHDKPLAIARPLDADLQRLHPAHRAADRAVEFFHPQRVEPDFLRAHHVADADKRKRHPKRPPRRGIERRRPAGALAAARDVGTEDEKFVRVHRLARADQVVPPAGLAVGRRVAAGTMVVAAERVADEHGVVAGGVEPAVSLVAQREAGECLPALEGERLRADEITRHDEPDLARSGRGGGGRAGLGGVHSGR